MMGISGPVFDADGDILGSIGLVIPAAQLAGYEIRFREAKDAVDLASDQLTLALRSK